MNAAKLPELVVVSPHHHRLHHEVHDQRSGRYHLKHVVVCEDGSEILKDCDCAEADVGYDDPFAQGQVRRVGEGEDGG